MNFVSISYEEIEKFLEEGYKENANMLYNPESIHKWVADKIMKKYALKKMFPNNIVKAHIDGDIHLHDLEYGVIRPVCCQHDLRPFLLHGLKVDGSGGHTSVSKPAKHPETVIQHAAKVMMASQTNMSGGQSIDEFNIWLAPYMKGLPYDRIKQLMQMFIYELNQMYVARGGQVIFSSINCEIGIPDFLRDKPAVCKGKIVGAYEEYEEESIMILEALVDVMIEGDAVGKPFLFPNFIVKLRENAFSNEYSDLMSKMHKLASKYGNIYFINMLPDWQVGNTNAMGCRTRLSGNWTGDVEEDTLRTGNMQWYTLNLPRIAYEANGNEERLFEILLEKMELIKEALLIKDNTVVKRLYENKMMPFLTQKFDGEQYYRFENTTKTLGFVGLNEMVKYHTGYELHEDKGAYEFGMKIVQEMKRYVNYLKETTGLRFTLTQTPAESTAGRFARLDWKKFNGKCRSVVNGNHNDVDSLYYSNSSHLNVNSNVSIGEKVKLEGDFHPLCNGGHILHFWNIESYADPDILMNITEKICKKSNTGFWTYTKNITTCNDCNHVSCGLHNKCLKCNSFNVCKFSRITGYLQNVSNWNKSKQEELINRKHNKY